jgi:DNA-directed RNA polymerase
MILHNDVRRAQYEDMIFNLADAFEGFQIYLPAFLDFRGRIYRSGIIHFHERDLARSFLLFDLSNINGYSGCLSENNIPRLKEAIAFHYKSFVQIKDASDWFETQYSTNLSKSIENFLLTSYNAKNPFQFIASTLPLMVGCKKTMSQIPITQDASASAYQIMSYLMLDGQIASYTNLLPNEGNLIKDIYTKMLEDLLNYIKMNKYLDQNQIQILDSNLNRKTIKKLFMPIVYGKTTMAMANDLKQVLSHYLTHKECWEVAKLCVKFWKEEYPHFDSLMTIVKTIGWIVSSRGSQVVYRTKFFATVQDYMKKEPVNIWVYDRVKKKRRQVTLRVPTQTRDRKKSQISTFVNFIHQKDAYIAMSVISDMIVRGYPIYTVHDNFISTADYCNSLSDIYIV